MVQARRPRRLEIMVTQDRQYDDTLINVFGGKITTAMGGPCPGGSAHPDRSKRWTAGTVLPGGNFAVLSFETLVIEAQRHFAFADRLAAAPIYTALSLGASQRP